MSMHIKLNRFHWRTRFNIDLGDLWKHYRLNNNIEKTAMLILDILNITDEIEYHKNELIKIYNKE